MDFNKIKLPSVVRLLNKFVEINLKKTYELFKKIKMVFNNYSILSKN